MFAMPRNLFLLSASLMIVVGFLLFPATSDRIVCTTIKRNSFWTELANNQNTIDKIDVIICRNKQWGREIPTEIGLLTNLVKLDLQYNSLLGTIPTEIGKLSKLNTLMLAHNLLTGKIPEEFSALTQINDMTIFANGKDGKKLTGCFPFPLKCRCNPNDNPDYYNCELDELSFCPSGGKTCPKVTPTKLPTKKPTENIGPTQKPTRAPTEYPTGHPTTRAPTRPLGTYVRKKQNVACKVKPSTLGEFPDIKTLEECIPECDAVWDCGRIIISDGEGCRLLYPSKGCITTKAGKNSIYKRTGNAPINPTQDPTKAPTKKPTKTPTKAPTRNPTKWPTEKPTNAPTNPPVDEPTKKPTPKPTFEPRPKGAYNTIREMMQCQFRPNFLSIFETITTLAECSVKCDAVPDCSRIMVGPSKGCRLMPTAGCKTFLSGNNILYERIGDASGTKAPTEKGKTSAPTEKAPTQKPTQKPTREPTT